MRRPEVSTRTLAVATGAALVVGLGSVLAVAASTGDSDSAATIAARGDRAAALGGMEQASTTMSPQVLVEDEAVAKAIAGALARANGAYQDGTPVHVLDDAPKTGALAFPVGVSYPEAVTQIYAAGLTGTAPAGARLVESLPLGKVAVIPSTSTEGVVIDLRAPFGYQPESPRRINATSFVFEDDVKGPADTQRLGAGIGPWKAGAHVDVPILPECMTLESSTADPGPACGAGDIPLNDADKLMGPRLP